MARCERFAGGGCRVARLARRSTRQLRWSCGLLDSAARLFTGAGGRDAARASGPVISTAMCVATGASRRSAATQLTSGGVSTPTSRSEMRRVKVARPTFSQVSSGSGEPPAGAASARWPGGTPSRLASGGTHSFCTLCTGVTRRAIVGAEKVGAKKGGDVILFTLQSCDPRRANARRAVPPLCLGPEGCGAGEAERSRANLLRSASGPPNPPTRGGLPIRLFRDCTRCGRPGAPPPHR
jgi:hypothetical protein